MTKLFMKQKKVLKEWIARRLDEKDFHTQVSKCLLETAQSNNLLLIFSDHLDFIRFDGAFYDYVYADHAPFYVTRNGLVRDEKAASDALEINPYKFGVRGDEVMSPSLYARLGKPVWNFLTDEMTGKAASFHIRERQDFGEGATYFCRGVVVDLDELFPAQQIQ